VSRIAKLVHKIPKLDQPVYGYDHQGYDSDAHETRVLAITEITTLLCLELKRPLKVLDLSCAQGFLVFHLAAQGFEVLGMDSNKENIELCKALAKDNPTLETTFIHGKPETIFEQTTHFDLIIGMNHFASVICHWSAVKIHKFIEKIAQISDFRILELTDQKNKKVSMTSFTNATPFCCEINEVSKQQRIFFLSNHYLLLNHQLWKFDTWKEESHALAGNNHQKSRRYYFQKNRIVKIFSFEGALKKINQEELSRELHFLTTNKNYPKVIQYLFEEKFGWIERELVIGENLLDLILTHKNFDTKKIIQSLLKKLVSLEKNQLYHQDLRPWNMLITKKNQVELIDYGDIRNQNTDVVYPHNIFFSFFITINDIVTREVHPILPTRAAKISPHHLPQPYSDWLHLVWQEPINTWTFQLIHKKWNEVKTRNAAQPIQAQELWNAKTEEYINTIRRFHDHEIIQLHKHFDLLQEKYDDILKRLIKLETNA
jgi:O-antigen chain-terminating bifunctional methyltransferase/kinase